MSRNIHNDEVDSLDGTLYKGSCFMVQVEPRPPEEDLGRPLLSIWIEDDEIWHHKCSFSAFWTDELLNLLRNSQKHA
jgi:hypothetical protein